LVPATAEYTDDNNATHVGMLRFGDCDISEDNAKTSAQREKANLTFKNPNLTHVKMLTITTRLAQLIDCLSKRRRNLGLTSLINKEFAMSTR